MKYLSLVILLFGCNISNKNNDLNDYINRKKFNYKDVSIYIVFNSGAKKTDISKDHLSKKLTELKSSIDNNMNKCKIRNLYTYSIDAYNHSVRLAEEIFN